MKARVLLAISLLLAACAPAPRPPQPSEPSIPAAGVALDDSSIQDAALVARLNVRFKNEVSSCPNNTPAYYCSGVLLRTVTYNANYKFWTHSAAATALGSVSFHFLRGDLSTSSLPGGVGFVFSDSTTAQQANKPYTLRCVYPFIAGIQGRPSNGCGFATTAASEVKAKAGAIETNQGSCASLNPPAVTGPLWLANFAKYGHDTRNQCSLNASTSEFRASLEGHQGGAEKAAWANEVVVQTWDPNQPAKLPIEAFFYDAASPASQTYALRLQSDYQAATGTLVPVLKLDMKAADRNVFLLPTGTGSGGPGVAAELNRRFNKLDNTCNGQAAFYCDGVMIRMTTWGAGYKVWNPSPTSVTLGGVSWSYLRRDQGITELAWDQALSEGLIFKNYNASIRDQDYFITLLCYFPTDAASIYRANSGCGAHPSYPTQSVFCTTLGIDTAAKWATHYHAVAGSGHFSARNQHQCGFASTPAYFALGLNIRPYFQIAADRRFHNEVMLRTWPQNIPSSLPIEAIFYHIKGTRGTGLAGAQNIQRDFKAATGKFVPVVRFSISQTTPFTYAAGDQAVTP
ncbi:hypothetical protein [Pseudomonas abieticivorans]|uniref:hypothetical protein n=1 Tax=Pseudomonas abieticivorans TaxID=2931382 RepID=UPI0020C03B7C|nr:hypothetical protein [Pseudomonas sp. PIA16]